MREQVVEELFLLRLVMAAETADHVGHPAAIVAVCDHPRALVHDLHPLPILLDYRSCLWHLRERIGVAA